MSRPRAIFFGTPAFAVPCLDALYEIADVVRVVTQPDRPAGRGMALAAPPVKTRALERGTEVVQPTKVRVPEFAELLRADRAEVGVVVAYGRILTKEVLAAPRLGCVNVHASLLPRFRGAAPIQWAIASGDAETGVCLMQMDEGMDTGPVLARRVTPIDPNETGLELGERLSRLGADILREELPHYLAGELRAEPQDHARATMAPLLEKENARVDFRLCARAVHDRIRAMTPWPGAFAFLDGKRVKLFGTRFSSPGISVDAPGTIVDVVDGALLVACGDGVIHLAEAQLEGRKRVRGAEMLVGLRLEAGARFDVDEVSR